MQALKILGLSAIFISLVACVSAPTKPSKLNSSQLQPMQDDASYFYGLGAGSNFEAAQNDALAQIAARIAVNVSASTKTNLSVTSLQGKELIDDSFERQVLAESKNIEFVGVEILAQNANQVLLQVSRPGLANHYQTKLEQGYQQLNADLNANQQLGVFEQLKRQPKLAQQLAQILANLSIMQALQPQFDQQKYQQISLAVQQQHAKLRNQAVFSLQADQNSQALAQVLQQQLTSEGFKISEQGNIQIQLQTQIKPLQLQSTDARIAQLYYVERQSQIRVLENQQILAEKQLKNRGSAKTNHQDASLDLTAYQREFANQTFVELLNQ